VKPRVLHVSHAICVTPAKQRCRERGLAAAATLGEAHLHLSSLGPGEVLSLGAFQHRPATTGDPLWSRSTGGRTAPAGEGFLLLTLALPHRAALVDERRLALAPEQVMNRCVRGVLRALRTLGVDATYPGLDLLTHRRRALATLAFTEFDGPTIFQAILAATTPLSTGASLLDRLDPGGIVSTDLPGPDDAATLVDLAGAHIAPELAPPRFADRAAAGYAGEFGIDPQVLDEDVTEVLADAYSQADEFVAPPRPSGDMVRAHGLLGPVEAWSHVDGHRLTAFTVTGNFIAPAATPAALGQALYGCPADPDEMERRITAFLDRDTHYFLGLRREDWRELTRRPHPTR